MFGGDISKTFYGLFDDSAFNLTMNSTLFPPLYVIKGKYKNTNNTLIINYTIEPNSKFGLLWMKFFPIIFLFVINLLFLLSSNKIPFEVFIVFNSFTIFILFYSRWDMKRRKKNMEKKFIEIFEII
jgi:hypothetical protein